MSYYSHASQKVLLGLLVAALFAYFLSSTSTFWFHPCIFSLDTNQYSKHAFPNTLGVLFHQQHSFYLSTLPADFHCWHKRNDFFFICLIHLSTSGRCHDLQIACLSVFPWNSTFFLELHSRLIFKLISKNKNPPRGTIMEQNKSDI